MFNNNVSLLSVKWTKRTPFNPVKEYVFAKNGMQCLFVYFFFLVHLDLIVTEIISASDWIYTSGEGGSPTIK